MAPDTERSKTRVARKVYRYKDAELARLVPPPPPPGDALAVGAPNVDGGETVTGGTNEDDMTF